MTYFRVTFTDGREELHEGERVVVEDDGQVAIRKSELVLGRPKDVVVRRVPGSDVHCVEQV